MIDRIVWKMFPTQGINTYADLFKLPEKERDAHLQAVEQAHDQIYEIISQNLLHSYSGTYKKDGSQEPPSFLFSLITSIVLAAIFCFVVKIADCPALPVSWWIWLILAAEFVLSIVPAYKLSSQKEMFLFSDDNSFTYESREKMYNRCLSMNVHSVNHSVVSIIMIWLIFILLVSVFYFFNFCA